MAKGRVKWYDEVKGFGFIETENDGDIFVHKSGIARGFRMPEPGQAVVFDTKQGDKGMVAFNVESDD